MPEQVVVIGGGLAGLAAATALGPRGFRVTILEARPRLGGRASSFPDAATGQLIDACQHVSMGCCTNLAHFCRTVGIDHFLAPQPVLYFMTADRRISQWTADRWPAPFHLARSFWHAHFLSWREKLQIGRGLLALLLADPEDDLPFAEWLTAHGQSPGTVERFWGVVLTSALNEAPERVGVRYARKVFVDGFLKHPRGGEVALPTVPLGRLYGAELRAWLERHQIQVRLGETGRALDMEHHRISAVELRSGEHLEADWFICAVPFDRLLQLLAESLTDAHACFRNLRQLESSPITSVHLWYDRPVLALPHVVLVGCVGQWVFNRGQPAAGEYYVQVVVSAARQFRDLKHDDVQRRIAEELARLFPTAAAAKLLRARVVTEQAATFSAVPGVDRWRPPPATPIANLFLAGDWTATGWPATMEGAVRSGYLAAEAILARTGRGERLVQPELNRR